MKPLIKVRISIYKYQVVKWFVVKAQFTHPIEEMSGGAQNAFLPSASSVKEGRGRGYDLFSLRGVYYDELNFLRSSFPSNSSKEGRGGKKKCRKVKHSPLPLLFIQRFSLQPPPRFTTTTTVRASAASEQN